MTDGFAKGQEVKTDAATMKVAMGKLGTQDPAQAEADPICLHSESSQLQMKTQLLPCSTLA